MYGKVTPGVQFKKTTATIVGGRDGASHYYSPDEVRAFATFINQYLSKDPELSNKLPIDPNNPDHFFNVFEDGILLCKLVNFISPNSIDPKHITNKGPGMPAIYKYQNLNNALNATRELGISLVNIGGDDFVKGNRHVVLGLIWQLIKFALLKKVNMVDHPEIVQLLSRGEDTKSFASLDGSEVILRWFNFNLKKAGHNRVVNNFGGDIQDGQNYLVLMSQIAPHIVPRTVLAEQNPQKRAEMVCQFANKMGVSPFVTPQTILAGTESLNLAFTADMFNKYPAIQAAAQYDELQARALEEARLKIEEQYKQQEAARAARWAQEEVLRKAQWEQEEAQRKAQWQQQDAQRQAQLQEEEAKRMAQLQQQELLMTAKWKEQDAQRQAQLQEEDARRRAQLQHMQQEESIRRQAWAREDDERKRKLEEEAKRHEEELRKLEEKKRQLSQQPTLSQPPPTFYTSTPTPDPTLYTPPPVNPVTLNNPPIVSPISTNVTTTNVGAYPSVPPYGPSYGYENMQPPVTELYPPPYGYDNTVPPFGMTSTTTYDMASMYPQPPPMYQQTTVTYQPPPATYQQTTTTTTFAPPYPGLPVGGPGFGYGFKYKKFKKKHKKHKKKYKKW